jgi:hypothetical protein
MSIEAIWQERYFVPEPSHDRGAVVISLVSTGSQHTARRRLLRRTVTTVINVPDEPCLLSQTQRRRRYPDHQQQARRNGLQSSHVSKRYSFDFLISTQIFPALIPATPIDGSLAAYI